MDEEDGLFTIFRREPEQTALILKFGFGGPVAIVLWDWIAGFFLSDLAILPASLFFILTYAGILTFLIARLVHTADRWQIESALQARRRVGDREPRLAEPVAVSAHVAETEIEAGIEAEPEVEAAPPPPPPPPPAVKVGFHEVYFLLRLKEEVLRARREGSSHLSVVALDVMLPGHELTPDVMEKIAFELAHIASNQAKTISYALSVGPTEFVFSLPHQDRAAVQDFVSKLVRALGDYWCHYGMAIYPEDATDAESLFNFARQQCENSRHDQRRNGSPIASIGRRR